MCHQGPPARGRSGRGRCRLRRPGRELRAGARRQGRWLGRSRRSVAHVALHRPAAVEQGASSLAWSWHCGSPSTGRRWRREIARRAPGAGCWCSSTWPASPVVAAVRPTTPRRWCAGAPRLGLDVRGPHGRGAPGPTEASRPGFRLLAGSPIDLEPPGAFDGDERATSRSRSRKGSTMVRVGTATRRWPDGPASTRAP